MNYMVYKFYLNKAVMLSPTCPKRTDTKVFARGEA